MPQESYTDEELLAMITGTSEERDAALKFFFTDPKLEDTVLQRIKRKGGDDYDAQDAYQEGFKVFYRQLQTGKFEGRSSLRTFFVGICIRCWLDGLKKSFYKRTTMVGDEQSLLEEEFQHSPEVELFSRERKSHLRKVLNLLGQQCKEVVMLKYEGFSDKEITEMMNFEDSVRVRKKRHRCMSKLFEKMKSEPGLMAILKQLNYG
jgi:RNA polymerase sigma-70 factor (ECF subfamily)